MTTEFKTYEGVERVRARPMTRGEYIAFRGWQLPADENPADGGYLVECMGDFISWCPKDRFERAYREVGQDALWRCTQVAQSWPACGA